MASMTGRERVLAALNHQQPDRVPIDFGGAQTTTMYYSAYDRLKARLGFDHETDIFSPIRRLATPHASIIEHFGVDTQILNIGRYEGPRRVIDEDAMVDEWGVTWRKALDGPHMPVDGPFVRSATLADLEKYAWPDPDNPGYTDGLGDAARALRRQSDRAIILNLTYGVVQQGQALRGFGPWMKDLYKNADFAKGLAEALAERAVRLIERALAAVGENIDMVFFGDDLASQQGPLFDPVKYRQVLKPGHRRMIAAIKKNSDAKVIYHSCGAVSAFVEDLIDVGVDALNPVQVNANNMDPGALKRKFGDRIAFWGGVDTQRVLPAGSPAEVRAEVRRMIDIMGAGGGYVLAAVHNIQPDAPTENVIAMFEEARDYRPSTP